MTFMTVALLVGGLIALIVGGELLVRGAARLAAAVGVSPLVIGLTVVAFGTSAPEMAVSIQAGLSGSADIAVANVVGSNIFNILLTAGLCAVVAPLLVNQQLVRLDVPIMIGVSILVFVMALDGRISTLDGVVLFAGIVGYTVFAIRESRKESMAVREEYGQEYADRNGRGWQALVLDGALIIGGLVVLVLGAGWMVEGATTLARFLGVSDVVIGLTIIAGGTSLPEVATSLVATWRGERDIAIGNLVGSNLFNLLAILGLSAIVLPNGLRVDPQLLRVDMLIMVGVAIACLPIFFKGSIARWEGMLFLGSYVLYTVFLVLQATESPALPGLMRLMLQFGLPALTIAVLLAGWQALLQSRNRSAERSAA